MPLEFRMPVLRLAQRIIAKFGGGGERRPAPPVSTHPGRVAPTVVPERTHSHSHSHAAPAEEAEADALARIDSNAQEVKERVEAGEPVVLLDVRPASATAKGVIPGAVLIPAEQVEARWTEVKDKNEIICYCSDGTKSLPVAQFLREKGIFNATYLEGGLKAWTAFEGKLVKVEKKKKA